MGSHSLEVPISWRFPLAFQFIFIFVLLGTVPWLPSPLVGSLHIVMWSKPQDSCRLEGLDAKGGHVTSDVKEIEFAVVFVR